MFILLFGLLGIFGLSILFVLADLGKLSSCRNALRQHWNILDAVSWGMVAMASVTEALLIMVNS